VDTNLRAQAAIEGPPLKRSVGGNKNRSACVFNL
jgi:hypothetical protein